MNFADYKVSFLLQNVVGYAEAVRLLIALEATEERVLVDELKRWLAIQDVKHHDEIVEDYEGVYDAKL